MFRKQLGDALSKDFPAMTALAVGSLDSRSLWAVTDQCWRLTRALWVWKDSQGPQLPSRQAYARATTDLQTSLPGRYTKEEDHQLDKVLKAPGATRVLQEVAIRFAQLTERCSNHERCSIALRIVPILQSRLLEIGAQVSAGAKTQF